MDTTTARPLRDTEKARRAALATYARRRAERAVAELESQGYTVTVIPPIGGVPAPAVSD